MLRRGLLIGGLGLSLTMVSAAVLPTAAQESSAGGSGTELTIEERVAAWEEERQQRYDDFLAAFAANLGIDDPAQVETAFKETLKQMIDEELAAGNIAANHAAELKQRIDEADGPILFHGFGGGRDGMLGRHDRMIGRGPGGRFHRPGRIFGEKPGGAGGTIEQTPSDEGADEVESLPATDEAESTPTN
jgi:hypothetical protein